MTVTVAEFITYSADRGRTVADDADAAAALVRGGDYIAYRYVPWMIDSTSAAMLALIDKATYEAAWIEYEAPNFFASNYTEAQTKTLTKVDAISWTANGETGGTFSYTPTSTIIAAMFAPYVRDPDAVGFMFASVG